MSCSGKKLTVNLSLYQGKDVQKNPFRTSGYEEKLYMFRSAFIRERIHFAWLFGLFLLLTTTVLLSASADITRVREAPLWERSLPSTSCPWSDSDTYCHRASPVLADITGDGNLEIIVATNRGHVQAYRYDGKLLWSTDIAPAFGMKRDTQKTASSPAVADIDADGYMEIVMGAGTVKRNICTQGGVIALEHDGSVKKGWPFLTKDGDIPPAGCRETVFATPALGDLDKDGDLEIVFGAFDKRFYALDHNGRLLPGFPPDSYHFLRFGWDNLIGRLGDTMWSSPALADLDGDGYLDIVTGADEGDYDGRFVPVMGSWSCPYRSPNTQGYCGGSVYAFDRFGQLIPGFPRYLYEIIQSTPALLDVDEDGRSEIFVGAGDYYYLNSPDKPKYGFRLFGLDSNGRDLPGWEGGKKVGGVVISSPAIGDIDGDNAPEIVFMAGDDRLYAFDLNGQRVPGFPMTPRIYTGLVLDSNTVGSTAILADYTGDGKMEIFVRHAWETNIIDGTGTQLTKTSSSDSKPAYITLGSLWNSPAVGDLDRDGRLELVSQNSELTVWTLPASSGLADWPMLKRDAARTGAVVPDIRVEPDTMHMVHESGKKTSYTTWLNLTSFAGTFDWALSTNVSGVISFPRESGRVNGTRMVSALLTIDGDLRPGVHKIGRIDLTISRDGAVHEVVRIPVSVTVFKDLNQSFLPALP